jgi:hypothetical protein
MQNINNYIIEKLKVSKDSVSDIDDESNDLQELAKQWTIWSRRQKARFPEILLRSMYKKHNIKRPSIMHPYNNTPYDLVSFMGYERTDGGCNVTLFYFYNNNKNLVMKKETKSYDELIELLGDGNIKDGEVIYNEILNKLYN